MVRIDDKPGIRFSIRKQSGANTVTVAENVTKELDEIAKFFPNIRIQPIFDSSKFITQSINNLRESAISGGLLAIFAAASVFAQHPQHPDRRGLDSDYDHRHLHADVCRRFLPSIRCRSARWRWGRNDRG
jgi:hypothetical protein